MRPSVKGPAERAAQATAATVADSTYSGVSLLSELLAQTKAAADRMPVGEDSDIAFLTNHAEWVASKLKDELVELDTAVKAAGWVE